ncbi:N-acyl-D-amino-acid deacylase family protein [Trinickia diaoshuihuensis]|uniref:N-acyl-D-amino-acid deacylase family protein n=1 Tax=Trinickia diaoshuihuensis TaxID=2292265 RepID=UPI001F07C718|nr:D-aminoacylase [Trinickia diaoshuihuensis]
MKLSILIRGATLIDGTKRPRVDADVGIDGDQIVFIGDASRLTADRVIDASGKILAPGFIDSHTHDDAALLLDPLMLAKVSQGVTSVVTGNCGVSTAPLADHAPRPMPLSLIASRELHGGASFPDFAGYLGALERSPASVNVIPMVGHTTLRVSAMDALDREARPDEVRAMQALLSEAMDAGAVGLSTGTYYPPAAAATTREIVEVCRPLAEKGGIYVTHMRDEADRCVESIEETLEIGRALGVPVVISHHKLAREQNFGRSLVTLPLIEAAMKCQCVGLDCYPYDASSTMLHQDEARLKGRVRIASSGSHPELVGHELADIAASWGVSLAEASKRLQPASAIYFSMDEADVQRILAFEQTMIGSDGLPSSEKPHPRLWGTFSRVLGRYCRELNLFPLETAIWKMTGLTARTFGIGRRGTIEVGNYADLVVFDAQTVGDRATYENPAQPSAGIETVIVNGEVTFARGVHIGRRAGRVLTRTR